MMAWAYIAVSDVILAVVFYMIGKHRGQKEAVFGIAVATAASFTKEELDYFNKRIMDGCNKYCKKGESK